MIEILIHIVYGLLLLPLAFHLGYGLWRLIEIPTRGWRESVFDYVYIDENGRARELNAEEDDHVTTVLFPDEEVHFFIKPRYESVSPDGRSCGYLRRNQLPRNAYVHPSPGDVN